MMNTAKINRRAERGFVMLHDRYGSEWVKWIDLDLLDMADGDLCVGGQIAQHQDQATSRSYSDFVEGESTRWITRNGFDVPPKVDNRGEADEYYTELTKAWTRLISLAQASLLVDA